MYVHCSIIRMISASHFPVLFGHFHHYQCVLTAFSLRPHLQVTPLGGGQEGWATLFTGLVLEMTGNFLEGSDFCCEEIPWSKGNQWLVSHYDKALFLGGYVEGNRLTSHNYWWCLKPIWQQTKFRNIYPQNFTRTVLCIPSGYRAISWNVDNSHMSHMICAMAAHTHVGFARTVLLQYRTNKQENKSCDRMIMIQIKNNSLFIFLFFLDVKAFPECQQLWCFCCSQRTVTSLKISVGYCGFWVIFPYPCLRLKFWHWTFTWFLGRETNRCLPQAFRIMK